MILPVKWLREYIELPAKARDLADILTMSGTKVEALGEKNGSDILHLEITTNRPDCLSLCGLAVEIGAVTGQKIHKRLPPAPKKPGKTELPLAIEIQDKKACPRYIGRVFDNVSVRPSPLAIQQKLDWMDQKSINNAVDITNFVLYELGQPLHAFDYDKVSGKRVVVRKAKKGEKIVAIDGNTYELDERILVIADAVKPIAIAGVMGGKETEVTASTKRVLLESAQFEPILIRRASRLLKLSSDSSYRFERSIDPNKTREASDRAAGMLAQFAGAEPASAVVDKSYGRAPKGVWIRLRLERMNALLGTAVPRAKAIKILASLGFKVKKSGKSEIKAKTLLQRRDVKREADLIEEIVRIYGFHKIPETIPSTRHEYRAAEASLEFAGVRRLKEFLAAQGFFEAVTYSLLSQKTVDGLRAGDDIIRVANAMSQEQEVMRPSGLAGLLQVLSHNVNRKEKDLAFFEIGKRFRGGAEENILAIAITGDIHSSWESKQKASFYYLKGLVESCLRFWHKTLPSWSESAPAGVFSESLALSSAAVCAAVDPEIAARWDLKQPVFYAEIDLERAAALPGAAKAHAALAKYPPVKRDVALLLPIEVPVERLCEIMRKAGGESLKDVALFDEYQGQNVPKGKRSLAFALEYQKKDGTFTEDEIRLLHVTVVECVKASGLGAEVRQ